MSRPGLTFSHMGIFVTDIQKMSDFYVRILEFTVTDRGQLPGPNGPVDLVFLSRDPAEHHQIVMVSGRPPTLSFNPINQISLRADSLKTLKLMYERVGRAITWEMFPVTHGNSLSLYVADPEGNRLEIYFDLPWYVSQPTRIPTDLSGSEESIMAAAEAHARSLPGFTMRTEWIKSMQAKMGLS
jgi:catechol 2,3-dioxygenase-like lactoylglutathione lyase family enzyme